jgi:ribosomal protein L16 Arg81 hydroxylase
MESINLKKRVGRPKGTTIKRVKQPKLTQADFDQALEVIANQRQEIAYLKASLDASRNSEEHFLMLFDNQVKETQAVCDLVFDTVESLKDAFKMGLNHTGEITALDIEYNLNLLPRFITHKFLKEDK